MKCDDTFKIAFISGKLGDVDGVSLEVDKWIEILSEMGHEIVTIAGRYASPVKHVREEWQLEEEDIRFDSPLQKYYEGQVFPFLSSRPQKIPARRSQKVMEEMLQKGEEVAARLYEIIQTHDIDVLVAQNTNAMPMTLLGGIAIHKLATEKRVAVVFHHHDFWWERSRFSHNHIEALLNRIMPPVDLGVEHVVISSYAAHILKSIKRVDPTVIPNCEDFEHPPVRDEYNQHFRKDLGFSDQDILIVQPTRIVPRKRIEDSVRLTGRFVRAYPEYREKTRFIVSLYQGDELDSSYVDHIEELARQEGVSLHLIADRVGSVRKTNKKGERLYTNRDVLVNADLVTYLPVWEGFGNALLEAVAARVPVVSTTYLVYKTDIQGCGFRNIEIRDRYDEEGRLVISDKVLKDIKFVLEHPSLAEEMTETNFRAGKEEFGYKTLRNKLERVFSQYADEIRASRKRLKKSKTFYFV